MRVVDRKTFLGLPEGTIYAKGVQWAFDGLAIKGKSLEDIDWYCLEPNGIEANDSSEVVERYEVMLRDGASFAMEDAYGRDGYFDQDAVFLVLELADLETLKGYIEAAIERLRGPEREEPGIESLRYNRILSNASDLRKDRA